MKKLTFTCTLFFSILIGFSQTKQYKRISINNVNTPIINTLSEIGVDLQCGAIIKNNTLELEISEDELRSIKNKNISYNVLIDDLSKFYEIRAKQNLPLALMELRTSKARTSQTRKFGTSSKVSSLINNIGQHNECDEIDWAVPNNFKLGSMGGCLTLSETLAELDLMRSLYPNLISVKQDASPSNQTTVEGRTTYYVRISDNPDIDEANEPETLYTGMTHSRELSSLMNLMYYMWYILENYNTDPAIKHLVDNQALYFIPVVNSDGLVYNETVAPNGGGLQRKNRNIYNGGCSTYTEGVDLNRNFGYYWNNGGSSSSTCSDTHRGPTHFSEPETQIIRDFFLQHDFELVLNHHSFKNAMLHGYAGVSPNTLDAAGVDRREDEFAKYNHDMTHFNRYAYGPSTQISALNSGNANDWMMGPAVAGPTGGPGAGKNAMAWTPENGSGAEAGSTGSGFWPNPIFIDDIAKRAMRANFLAAYYSGKYAKLIDLTPSNINTLNGNLNFGIEFLGQTSSDFTVTVTPISSNIASITNPSVQTGMVTLEQRNVNVPYTLNGTISAGDEIEYKVSLSNDDGVIYEVNVKKYFTPAVLIQDNPDTDNLSNWTASGTWGTTNDAFSGSLAITDSPSGAYGNNTSKTLQLNNSINTNSASETIIQFYAKWDLERSFDYVQVEASTNGSNWSPLCGTYTKPGAPNANNTYSGKSNANNNFQPDGEPLYDGDTQDKWVMEEIVINPSNNSTFDNQSTVFIRFNFRTDSTNNQDSYTTTFDGFTFDDFRIISLQAPCVIDVPSNLSSSNITETEATITWNNIPSATYDLRYRVAGTQNWTDVNALTSPSYSFTGLANLTEYEVQVRANCATNNSAYSASINFTTLDVQLNYCDSASRNVNDEFISRVQLNTIDNSSGGQFYSDFTNISTTLTKDSQYSITITPTWTGTVYNEAYSVWIDYNRDGDFNDSGEQVFTQGNTRATSVSGNFTIPSTAVENSTRMRVSMKYNAIPTSCESFQYGEVEDYNIVIEGLGPDIVPPVITLNGASSIDLNVGDTYVEAGATAVDDEDGDITADIVIGGDIVNTNAGGTYTVTYNVSDTAGNAATQVTRTVNVIPDTTAPVITLNGAATIDLNVGETYTEAGATATDNIDGDITANIIIGGDVVNTNVGGTYTVTYNVSDAAGNAATQITRTVNVIPDTTAPVITLNGAATIDLNVGDTYVEAGATAVDDEDGDITADIVIGGDIVNTNAGGTYTVTYNVSDAAGNAANQVTRTVNVIPDTTAPVITLNGAAIIDISIGGTYNELDATATDNIDGDITSNIIISGDVVDTNTGGVYLITYDVSDTAGNAAAQVVRTVNVIPDTTAPVITLTGNTTINLNLGEAYVEQGATASDNIDGDISSSITIGGDIVDINVVNTYSITYNVSDTAGNTATEVIRTVNVLPDTTAPVITLVGSASLSLNLGDTYVEQGATAIDNLDGDITANIVITDNINTLVAGTYFVNYTVSDTSGNIANTVTRTVTIIADTTAPTIALVGASTINLNVGDTYSEQGATASDDIDGDISANVIIGGDTVNTNVADTYNITYDVSDASGNTATQLSRTVIVSPIINGCSGGIASFPYAEGFENTLGGWVQSTSDDLDWLINSNGTLSNNTGPSNATQGSFYLYVEASVNGTGYPNKRAILTSPCFDLSALTEATFSFKYHMFGASNMGTIALEISDDEGDTWTSIWSESGNKGNAWQTVNINLSAYTGSAVQLRFNRFVGSTWQADIAIDDISLIDEELVIESCAGGIDSYPYAESFENTLGGWTQSTNDDINWTVDANGTPSNNTGPSGAIAGNFYIYVEASGNGNGFPNKQAIINSPCYDLSAVTTASFSFNYHMFGSNDMGTIALEASNDNGLSWVTLWSETGNKGDSWQSQTVDLSAYIGNSVQLRFNRVTGGTWQADIALDNISLTTNSATAKSESSKLNTANNSLSIYPNPVQDILTIKTLKIGNIDFKIINALGQIVKEGKTGNKLLVDRLEAGVYFIEVTQDGDKMMKRFIKE